MKKSQKLVTITVKLSPQQAAPFIRAAAFQKTEPGNVLLALATAALWTTDGDTHDEKQKLAALLWESCIVRVTGAPGWTGSDQFEKQPAARVA